MKIAILGDIAFLGNFSILHNKKLISNLSTLSKYLKDFDYVVGNLETPFSKNKKTFGAKSAYICTCSENIKLLNVLGIDAVTLANNHMFDYGKEGYELTKKLLTENNIEWFGAEGKILKREFNDSKIAFSGFCCYSSNPLKCVNNGGYGVNAYNLKEVDNILKQNDLDGYLNIVSVHAGLEHINNPSKEHILAARKLARTVPYIYYGHHPHVIQGVEEYKGSLIAHSLGNFCFDNVYSDNSSKNLLVELTDNNRTGMILEITIENNKILNWHEQIIYIEKDGNISLINNVDILKKYSKTLSEFDCNPESYINNRKLQLAKRIKERKALRDWKWYLKRIKPRYVKLIIDMKLNVKKYEKNLLRYLE